MRERSERAKFLCLCQFNIFSLYLCKYNWQKDHTSIFLQTFLFKVGIVGVFQEKVGKSRKVSKK